MGRTADYSRQSCTVAGALEIVGDPWTMLVIRDAFNGITRFEQWQERLGVARNVLAARLKSLVHHGVLEQRLYSERPPRNEYVLTAKGKDLYGVLITLAAWGEKHVYHDEASGISMRHKTCGQTLRPRIACGCCNELVRPREVEVVFDANRPTVGDMMPKDEVAKEEMA